MKAETMTPDMARSFDGYSSGNAMAVKACFPCGCEPYQDVFTFNRWKAQGYFVRKGEHGIKLALVKSISRENHETGEVETRRLLGSSVVFCRHQVESKTSSYDDMGRTGLCVPAKGLPASFWERNR